MGISSSALGVNYIGPCVFEVFLRDCSWALLLASLMLWVGYVHADPLAAPRAVREAAVAQARAGDPKAGLVTLQSLVKRYPEDSRLLADTVIVATMAGHDALALQLYAHALTPKNDAGVVEAAARSARNLHQYGLALRLYRQAESLAPERWQPRLGEAMVLTDEGKYPPAAVLVAPLMQHHGKERDVMVGEAYLCRRQGDLACTLAIEERLLQRTPQDAAIGCELADTLAQAGGETQALQFCSGAGSLQQRSLSASVGAEDVRWGETFARTRKQQEVETKQALARFDAVIAASSSSDPVWRRAQFDRLLALVDLWRMRDAIQSYEKLRQQNIEVPFYARLSVASAYLGTRQPHRAAALYKQLVQHSSEDGAAWSGLAYAQLESEHIEEAFRSIDYAYAHSPSWMQSPGLAVAQSNSIHADLGLQAAQLRGYVGMFGEQQRRIAGLLNLAPADIELGRAMAVDYLARGWPLRAIQRERIADSYAEEDELPSRQSLEIEEGAGRRDIVDAQLPALLEREGMSPPIQLFLRDRAIERSWQYDAEGAYEWASGAFIGSTDEHTESHLYTPLLDNRWRIYAHELHDSGTFIEGPAVRTRGGLGVSYNYDRQQAWAEVAGDTGTKGTNPAANIGTKLSFGDHWTFDATADSDSIADVELIAAISKVQGRSVDLGVGWRASELRSATFGLQRVLFSDGNQRAAISGKFDQRVWTSPRLKINIAPEEWASGNSENEDRLYFNPKHDFSLGPRGTVDWLTWRRYDTSFHQEFTVYSAPYWQQYYGVGTAFEVGYAQTWKLNARVGLTDGVAFDSQPYDGVNETYTALNAGITWGNQ